MAELAERLRALTSAPGPGKPAQPVVLLIDNLECAGRLGLEALERNDPRSAAEHFRIACKSDPKAQPLWMNLARAHRALGDPGSEREALDFVRRADFRPGSHKHMWIMVPSPAWVTTTIPNTRSWRGEAVVSPWLAARRRAMT